MTIMNAKLAALSRLVRPATDAEVRAILRAEDDESPRSDEFVDAAADGREEFWTSAMMGQSQAA